jgi:two-component system response regulator YesN
MNFNVLIVDDEPKIRNGIASSINWNEIGLNLVGTASDGREALQMAQKQKLDICIADICMPFIDGLDLIDKLKEINPGIITIIISGYDKFEYAMNAVKLKVFDYILKPIDETALLNTVLKAKKELEENALREKSLIQAAKQLNKSMPYLRERFLQECLNDEIDPLELKELMEFYQIRLSNEMGLILVKLDETDLMETTDEKNKQIMLFSLQGVLENLLEQLPCFYSIRDRRDNIVILAEPTNEWAAFCNQLPELLLHHSGVKNRMYFSGVINPAEIAEAYEDLVKQATTDNEYTPVISNVKKYIEEQYSDSMLSLKSAAEKMNINLYYLCRMFKQEVGVSFSGYLTKIRIREAIKLMHNDQMKIHEIAEKVGYNSQHYFSSAFKKVLGIAPSEYKNKSETGR